MRLQTLSLEGDFPEFESLFVLTLGNNPPKSFGYQGF